MWRLSSNKGVGDGSPKTSANRTAGGDQAYYCLMPIVTNSLERRRPSRAAQASLVNKLTREIHRMSTNSLGPMDIPHDLASAS